MDKPEQAFVTSVRVDSRGSHEWVTVWIQGRNVGTLTVGQGDGERLKLLLMPELVDAKLEAFFDPGVQRDIDAERTRHHDLVDVIEIPVRLGRRHG